MHLSWLFLILALPVAGIGLYAYRRDFRLHGRSTLAGLGLYLFGWLLFHCALGFSFPMTFVPKTAVQYVGVGLMILGLGAAMFATANFRSMRIAFGRDPSRLVRTGFYRFSRNPQYVFYALFLLGYAMMGRSVTAYLVVAIFCVVLHLTVLAEEEHLERVFGDEYREFRKATPRYLLIGRG